jgi:hypothetical protein
MLSNGAASRAVVGVVVVFGAMLLLVTPVVAGILDASWNAPTTNADGTPLTDLARYRIYVGTTSTPCPSSSVVFEMASATPAPSAGQVVTARLTGLDTDTSYYVSVTAIDGGGAESGCSTPAAAARARIDFAVSPTGTTDFGTVPLGGSVDRSFTVTNTGGGTVTGSVAASAPFSVVSGASFSLADAGATKTVTVRFSPTVAASATANVTFTANGGTLTRVVTGAGVSGSGGGTDSTAPAVAITSPTSGSVYATRNATVTLGGTASDDVGVTAVTWTNDRGGSGTASGTGSWTASGIALQPGSNIVTVTARDAAGNANRRQLTVTLDATAPTVSITAPSAGATVSGAIAVAASARDNVRVVGVQFLLDGVALGAEDTTAPYTISWDTRKATTGSHVLTARARDASGNRATSSVTVTVRNSTSTTLLQNGGFEYSVRGLANAWYVNTDGGIAYTLAKVTGELGYAQNITITTPGSWGLYFYQKPPLVVNRTYEWTLSYRTSGANSVWAQITDAAMTARVLSQALPGTRGAWTRLTIRFVHTDAKADMLRILTNDAGGVWLDRFVLREVITSASRPDPYVGPGAAKVSTRWTSASHEAMRTAFHFVARARTMILRSGA